MSLMRTTFELRLAFVANLQGVDDRWSVWAMIDCSVTKAHHAGAVMATLLKPRTETFATLIITD